MKSSVEPGRLSFDVIPNRSARGFIWTGAAHAAPSCLKLHPRHSARKAGSDDLLFLRGLPSTDEHHCFPAQSGSLKMMYEIHSTHRPKM